jgi:hypothetical protein
MLRLWHQLTVKLKQFVALPAAKHFLIPLQQQFIAHCEKKLNRQEFVQISLVTAKQFTGMCAKLLVTFSI